MTRIVVTGGAGFIGSNLCRRLLDAGNYVICVDNFYTGSKKNISDLQKNNRFELIEHDVTEPLKLLDINEIYNLACPASPPRYQRDPLFTFRTSVWGAWNMLELARENKARLLQASTSEVYGDPHVHPQVESYWGNVNPVGLRACYDEGKRSAETLLMDAHRQYGVDVKIVRIFNTYGPGMDPDDGRVVSNFIVQALRGLSLTMFGDGSQTRSFCYVDDLVSGIIATMALPSGQTGPINLGNPVEFTIVELATIIQELLSKSIEINRLPLPLDDPRQRKPDISRANELLAWDPKTDLRLGLVKTIDYFKRELAL